MKKKTTATRLLVIVLEEPRSARGAGSHSGPPPPPPRHDKGHQLDMMVAAPSEEADRQQRRADRLDERGHDQQRRQMRHLVEQRDVRPSEDLRQSVLQEEKADDETQDAERTGGPQLVAMIVSSVVWGVQDPAA